MVRKGGGHCGCCTYLANMDPILHRIVADQGSKLEDATHCKCCRYWRTKGVHQDLAKARKTREASA